LSSGSSEIGLELLAGSGAKENKIIPKITIPSRMRIIFFFMIN